MDNFRLALEDCELNDLGFSGPKFTWTNKRGGSDLIQERLDKCVCNVGWRNLFPLASVSHLDFWKSDHRPIVLNIVDRLPTVSRGHRFHYESAWAARDDFHRIVSNAWESRFGGDSMTIFRSRLASCATDLQRWNRINFRNSKASIVAKKRELAEVNNKGTCGSGDWKLVQRIEGELDDLLREEESYWRQRSRVSWLQERERNSKLSTPKRLREGIGTVFMSCLMFRVCGGSLTKRWRELLAAIFLHYLPVPGLIGSVWRLCVMLSMQGCRKIFVIHWMWSLQMMRLGMFSSR